MIIDNLKKYIKTCPLLSGAAINVNYLGDGPVRYSIDNIPAMPVVKRYTDGGTLRQYLFMLSSREAYDENTLANMQVAQFFEEFGAWIEEQDSKGIFPQFSDPKCCATKIEVTSSGYLSTADSKTARFQISLRLTYRKEM